jgi:hypothetical protein
MAQRVMSDKVKKAIEDYAAKLRSASDVTIYLKG